MTELEAMDAVLTTLVYRIGGDIPYFVKKKLEQLTVHTGGWVPSYEEGTEALRILRERSERLAAGGSETCPYELGIKIGTITATGAVLEDLSIHLNALADWHNNAALTVKEAREELMNE